MDLDKKNSGIIGGLISFLIFFIPTGYIIIQVSGPYLIVLLPFLFGAFILSAFVAFTIYKHINQAR